MVRRPLNQNLLLTILLISLAGLGLLYTMLTPEPPMTEALPDRSIYNASPTGYRAWHLSNQKAGIPMRPWQKPFTELDAMPGPATMLMVEPYTVAKTSVIFGQKEAAMLLGWVAEGNTLVLLDDFRRYGSNAIAYTLALEVERSRQRQPSSTGSPSVTFQALTPSKAPKQLNTYVRQRLMTQGDLSFRRNRAAKFPSQTLLSTPAENPVLIRMPYHKGVLILGTVVDLGQNTYLHRPANDNYQFLSNVLVNEKKPIFVNEFIHGYTESEDIFAYYQKQTPLGAIFGQLLLVLLVMLWLAFVRWTPKPDEQEGQAKNQAQEPDGMERYIQSMAGVYYRTQSAPLALEPLLNRLDSLLRKQFRLSLKEETDENELRHLLGSVFAHYSNKGSEIDPSPDALLNVLKQAQSVVSKQKRLSHQELLKLARQLTMIEERLHDYGTRNSTRIHTFHR